MSACGRWILTEQFVARRGGLAARLAGNENVNDAERLRHDPAMRWAASVPNPKFASFLGTLCSELRIRKDTRNL
jgi:hypothetical protein